MGTQVSIEAYGGRPGPSQCWNCQGFCHSSEVCKLPKKCVKCANPHNAKDCDRPFEEAPTCANYKGPHAANWGNCLANGKKQQIEKKNTVKAAPPIIRPISQQIPYANVAAGISQKVSAVSVLPHSSTTTTPQEFTPQRLPTPPVPSNANFVPAPVTAMPLRSHPATGIPPFSMQNTPPTTQPHPVSDPMDIIGELLKVINQGLVPLLLVEAFHQCIPQLQQTTDSHVRAHIIFRQYVMMTHPTA
ncbi:uncharacterized protein CEXT_68291 [Caerostris extrusa]|uniref:Uncharacterized protein n=1 Tax=Caerostris extrusa TaxID=172846 RepID=A0AAV4UW44_CAEEX|nr:uncharacterized protein CEXT_68291 [Caerostris extrusa]